jgi:hypothetical protein
VTEDADGGEKRPTFACPNCGAGLYPSEDVCTKCGFLRLSVSGPGANPSAGAVAIGCGGGFSAAVVSAVLAYLTMSAHAPPALVYVVEAMLAVICFIGFRALMARNAHASSAIYAFVVVFVIIFGGFAACFASFTNFRVQ